jgi:hypothetical protein
MVSGNFRTAFNDPTAPDHGGLLTDCHLRAVVAWFGRSWKIALRLNEEIGIVMRWAQSIRRNPLAEKLIEYEVGWDRKPRLDDWLISYGQAKTKSDDGRDISEYVRAVSAKWLISAVARAMSTNPQTGVKADAMLVIEGRQGLRKSSLIRAVACALGETYFVEGYHLGAGRDDALKLRNVLIVEWAELSGLGKRDVREIKNFLSLQVDKYRDIFGKLHAANPRTAIFCGSTNDSTYLADPTGGRRFWPVRLERINLDAFEQDVGQIWGEAVARWRGGERWWFDEHDARDVRVIQMAESEQFRRRTVSIWEEAGTDLAEQLVRGHLVVRDEASYKRFGYFGHTHEAASLDGNFGVDQMRHWLGRGDEGADKFDDASWLKAVEGLKASGWEAVTINGRRRYRLSVENRNALVKLHRPDLLSKPTTSKQIAKAKRGPLGRIAEAERVRKAAIIKAMGADTTETQN